MTDHGGHLSRPAGGGKQVMAESGIPDLVKHCNWCSWFRLECPACGLRFWNGMWQWVGYSMHYASTHLGVRVFRGLSDG